MLKQLRSTLLFSFIVLLLSTTTLFSQTITSFTPASGPAGTLVTITGTGLNSTTAVTINGTSAIVVSKSSSQAVILVMPGTTSGALQLTAVGNVSHGTFTVSTANSALGPTGTKVIDQIGSRQGTSVAISADGTTAVIGDAGDNTNVGAAYIYVRSGNTWTQQGSKLVGASASGTSYQGESVAISADGNTVVVGGFGDGLSVGAFWVYSRSGTSWSAQGGKMIGSSDGNSAQQGYSVAISADGNTIIAGGPNESSSTGAAWIFTRSGTTWTEKTKLVGTSASGAAKQGYAVAISADGTTVMVGGKDDNSNKGAVWIYTLTSGTWGPAGGTKLSPTVIGSSGSAGSALSLSSDGNTAAIGGVSDDANKGAIWIYTRTGNVWTFQQKLIDPVSGTSHFFGNSVSLSADGNKLIAGERGFNSNQGKSFLFSRTGTTWSAGVATTTNNETGRQHGYSIAMSSNGATALSGASGGSEPVWSYTSSSGNADLASLSTSYGGAVSGFAGSMLSHSVLVDVNTATLSFTATPSDANATVLIQMNGGGYLPDNTVFNLNSTNTADIRVTAQDGTTRIYVVEIKRPPLIISFTPSSGPVGSLVTINGTNLTPATDVKFGGISALIISNTSTKIVAMVMPGATTGAVTVTASGTASAPQNFTVNTILAPNIQQGNKLVGTSYTSGSYQGTGVAVSADGNTAVIGASGNASNSGAVWIYKRTGTSWAQEAGPLVGSSTGTTSYQGAAVGISADGNTVIVGALYDNSNQGAAWIWSRTGNSWTQQSTKLIGTGGTGYAQQGQSVALSADGNTAVVGGPADDNYRGSIWVYTRTGNTWAQYGNKLIATGSAASALVGISASISADGKTIAAGAVNENGVYIFNLTGSTWTSHGTKLTPTDAAGTSGAGNAVALNADGSTVFFSGTSDNSNTGAGWVFTKSTGTWSQQGSKLLSTGGSGGLKGTAVSISADGNTAVISNKNDSGSAGAIWIWKRSGSTWTQAPAKLVATGQSGSPQLGYSASLSADGSTLVSGGPPDGSNVGAAWVFIGLSPDANLSALTLSAGTLAPAFAAATTSYTASVSNSTNTITVTPTKNETNATIQVQLNSGGYSTVISGAASTALTLNVGINTVDVKVTAQDGTIKTYTLTITRKNTQTITFSPTATTTYGTTDFDPGATSTSANAIIYSSSDPAVATIVTGKIHIIGPGTVTITADQAADATYDAATQASQTLTINKANQLITFNPLPNKTVSDAAFSLSATGGGSGIQVTYVSSNTAVATISGSTVTIAGAGSTNITASQPGDSNYNAASDVMQTLTVQSSDANLSSLSLSAGTLSPTFASVTTNYTASVANATSTITITPTRNQAYAVIQVRINGGSYSAITSGAASGTLSLNIGDNIIDVLVTAQDGLTTKTYTTTVTRVSTDANLASLVLSAGTLSPTFASATITYTSTVLNTVSALTVTPTRNNGSATIQVQVNGAGYTTVVSGDASGSLALNVGTNTINVKVTAQDGTTTKTYTTTVTRSLSIDADLSALTLSVGTLSPTFAAGTTAYTASVTNSTSSITVTPTKNHANATILVRVNTGSYAAVVSGAASNALALNVGSNTVDVRVTAQDGTIKIYTTTVTRVATNANLSALTLSTGTLSPTFAAGTITYTATTTNATTSITVTPTKSHANASMQIQVNGGGYTGINSATASDPLALNIGANTVNVLVTAQDGTTTKTYTVTVTRPSNDNNLTGLTTTAGTLSPAFSSGTTTYTTANVSNLVSSVTITPTKSQANANAFVQINGGGYNFTPNGNPSSALALNVGVNTIDVRITAQDFSTKTYTITVTRLPSTDATLSSLDFNAADISPVFIPATTSYTVIVNSGTTELTLLPILNQPNATIQMRINSGSYSAINSGEFSSALTLSLTGTSIIDVLVTAQDGVTTKTYTFNVTHAAASTISSISPNIAPIGSLITISGTNLNQATDVKFGGVSGLIISNTGTAIVAMPMPGSVTGTVSVTASGTVVSSGIFTVSRAAVPTTQQGALMKPPTAASDSRLGAAVAISADGNTAIAGGPGDDVSRGSVFILVRNGGVWTQQAKILNVTLYGGNSNDYAGVSVAVSADGNTIVFGSPLSNSLAGAILIYTRSGTTWTFRSVKTGLPNSQMGHSVAISADGKTIVAGNRAHNSNRGALTIFKRSGNIFLQDGTPILGDVVNSYLGSSIAISGDGNTLLAGGYNNDGTASIYVKSSGVWVQQGSKLNGTGGENFGTSVALNADGNTALIGAKLNGGTTGKAYVYTRNSNTWSQETSISIATSIAYVGSAVSLNSTGNTAIVSAQNISSLDGASWIFTRSGTIWTQGANLVGSNGSRGQGISVSMSADGTTAFVGSDYADNAGAAWAFTGVSADADLSALVLSSGTLSPVFSAGTTAYAAAVSNATSALTVTPYKNDANATIQVQVNSGSYATVANGTASGALSLNIGSNTVNIKVTAQDGTTIKTYTITVTRRNTQTITFNALTTVTFGTADFSPGATSTSANAVVYGTSDAAVATVVDGKIHIVAAGTVTITADQPQDATYEAAIQKTQTLTINKANQTITFGALAAVTYGDTPVSLTATGGASGNVVTYVSSNNAVATISGSTVTIVGAGTVNITASQTGNGNYNAASDVVQILTVNKATATITLGSLTPTYDGTPKAVTSTSTPTSLNTVSYTYAGSATAPTNAGTYAVIATLSNPNYTASQTGSLVISKADQAITFNALIHKTFGDSNFNLTATGGSSGNGITYVSSNTSVATISGNTITIVGAGITNITASQAGNSNYNAAPDVIQALTVDKAAQTITFNALANKTYGDAAFNLTAIGGSSGLAITYVSSNPSVATITGNTVTIVGAGTINITASQAGNGNFNAASDVLRSVTVDKATATIVLGSLTQNYDGAPHSATATTTPASLSTISFTYDGSSTAPNNAGTYAVVATLNNANYTGTQSGSLVIGKANQAITFNSLANKTFLDAAFSLTATGGGSANAVTYVSSNIAVATISGNTVTIVGPGTTNITASQAGNTNYNVAADVVQSFTVDKTGQSITFSPLANKSYGDAPFNLNASGGGSGNTISYVSSNTSVATISGNLMTITGVGTTNITASQTANANYYASADITQTLTIDKGAQIITLNLLPNKTYGDAPFNLNATGGASGNVITFTSSNPGVATISGNTVTIVGAGKTTITADQTGNSDYQAAASVFKDLIIEKAPLLITGINTSKTYNGLLYNGGNGVSYSGFKNGEDQSSLSGALTYAGTSQGAKDAGLYTIIPSGLTSSNYQINFLSGNLQINKASLTIAADNKTKKENQANPTFSVTYTGFVNGETSAVLTKPLTITSTAAINSKEGSYPIILSEAASPNYLIALTNGLLTIESVTIPNKAPSMDDVANRIVCSTTEKQSISLTGINSGGEAGQTVSISVSASNAKLFETLSVNGTGNTAEIIYKPKNIHGGLSTITVTLTDNGGTINGGVDTYTKTFTLTVNPLPSVTLNSDLGDTIQRGLTATLTASGGTTYIWTDNKGIIQGQNTGTLTVSPIQTTTYTVTAVNDAGCKVSESLNISVLSVPKVLVSNVLTPNNDGKNDEWMIKNIELYPPHTVKVFDRSGRVVYQKKNYTNNWDGTYNGENLAEGTYFYIIDFDSAIQPMRGSLTIIRNLTVNN